MGVPGGAAPSCWVPSDLLARGSAQPESEATKMGKASAATMRWMSMVEAVIDELAPRDFAVGLAAVPD
jgi:hypothetical protein